MNIFERLFSWAEPLEFRWVGRKDPEYPVTAQQSFVGSLVALGISLAIALIYAQDHGSNSAAKVMVPILVALDLLVFAWVAIRRKEIWSHPGRAGRWFLCHGLVIFVGGYLSFCLAFLLAAFIMAFFWAIIFIWWFWKHAVAPSLKPSPPPPPPKLGAGEVLVEDGLGTKKLRHSMLSGNWMDEHGEEYERIPFSDDFVKKE